MSAPTAVSVTERIDGRAPRGAWWVALRLHRNIVLVGLGLLAVMAGLVLWHRAAVLNLYAGNGIVDPIACQAANGSTREISLECANQLRLMSDLSAPWEQLKLSWLLLPSIIGAAAGAALFSREFERRSQVFALTQSIGLLRWFATKTVVVLLPLLAASIGVGFLFEVTANTYGAASWTPIGAPTFSDFGFVPGSVLLVSFTLSVAVSTVLRQSLSAVLASTVAALGLLWALVSGYQDLTTAARTTAPVTAHFQLPSPERSVSIHSGFLDNSGHEMWVSYECTSWEGEPSPSEIDRIRKDCFASQGATQQFVDYLPLSSRTQLTWTVSGISAALSAVFLALGFAVLRRRAV